MKQEEVIMTEIEKSIRAAYTEREVSLQWYTFCDEIQHHNRFFPKSKFWEEYIQRLPQYTDTIEKEVGILYRARAINPSEYRLLDFKQQFSGFDKKGSGAPPADKAGSGRANPAGIPYLYLASDSATACAEVCPYMTQLISVAEFELKDKITVVDLCQFVNSEKDDIDRVALHTAMCRIMGEFMLPRGDKHDVDYAVSQFIAAYIQSKGAHGVKYLSSHNPRKDSFNLVLFDPEMASCVSERGTVYRCIYEHRKFQRMVTGLSDEQKVHETMVDYGCLEDPEITKQLSLMREQFDNIEK